MTRTRSPGDPPAPPPPDRLFTQTHCSFKVCEERVREHIRALGHLPPPLGPEAAAEPRDDPYDFKDGDVEYSFPTSKRLKGQERDPARKMKVAALSRAGVHVPIGSPAADIG